MKIYEDVTQTVGNTPLVKLKRIVPENSGSIVAKLEYFNPASSIKDRIAKNMIDAAEQEGKLKPGGVIIEPTSGNTGLGLAMVAAARGYKLIITMPETMSVERRALLKHFGAEIVLTPGDTGMGGAIEKAEEILGKNPDAFMPQQFKNAHNPEIHRLTTAKEILEDTDGNIDFFVCGVGTGGTITGTGEALKKHKPDIKVIAVEPETSAVLSGNASGKHGIQGIGAGFIPEILNIDIIDEIIKVNDENSYKTAKELAVKEGIFCGISSGAAVWAALQIAGRKENSGKNIIVILPDTGERYLSTPLFAS